MLATAPASPVWKNMAAIIPTADIENISLTPTPLVVKGHWPVDWSATQPLAGLRLDTPRLHPSRFTVASVWGLTISAVWRSIICCMPPVNAGWISAFSAPSTPMGVVSAGIPMSTSPSPAAALMRPESGRKSASVKMPFAPARCGISPDVAERLVWRRRYTALPDAHHHRITVA